MEQKKLSFRNKEGGRRTFANNGERIIADIILEIPSIAIEDYTTEGKPRVVDLEELMGEQITEGQRDQAFTAYEKAEAATKKKAEAERKAAEAAEKAKQVSTDPVKPEDKSDV